MLRDPFGASNRLTSYRWPTPPSQESSHRGGVDSQNEGEKNVEISNYVTSPRQKQPQISPIFKADTVRLHVSREKDRKLRLVDAGWDDPKVVPPDGYGQARRVEGWILTPLAGEAAAPPRQKSRPPRDPPFLTSDRCRSRASNRAFFALVFEVALRVTAPSVMRNGPP